MKALRDRLDRARPAFQVHGRFHRLLPLFDYVETTLFESGRATTGAPHVRAMLDWKRALTLVRLALTPCVLMALWNTGRQANLALAELGRASASGWRGGLLDLLGLGVDPGSVAASAVHGALYFIPCYLVALVVGVAWKLVFAIGRQRPITEGVAVTALLFPLMLPPAVPLWQVALGMSFGVVFAEELFGGTGRNFVNAALAARAFIYFAYPAAHAGNAVWVAVDGYSGATPLTSVSMADAATGMEAAGRTWADAFLGVMPGSMGETSTLACLLGAALLIATGVASWRVMV
ncbi:MAG: RnfABCDGE type electron transport complex subunit D, partial [Planctomycetota bacterium]|nr:RnfABCDGE type electron transport complex subunit D [Planctomycetota bacterium]